MASLLTFVGNAVVRLCALGLVCLAGATAAALLASWDWRLDLFSHFRLWYLLGTAACLAVLIAARRWRLSVVGAIVLIINIAAVLPYYLPRAQAGNDSPKLRVLLSNVLSSNSDTESLLQLIDHEQPDVIALLEVDLQWARSLRALSAKYPHSLVEPREDNFGIALYSRLPLVEARKVAIGQAGIPSLAAKIDWPERGTPVGIVVTHPLPPLGRNNAALRNGQLVELADYLQKLDLPAAVLGDLNATPWSPHFAKLLEDAELHDPRLGRGVLPSWPTMWPAALRIPIDHVLCRGKLVVHDLRLGPHIGSDHLPLIADLEQRD